MKSVLSVNTALDELATLVGQDIALVGILRFEFEVTAWTISQNQSAAMRQMTARPSH